MSKPNSETCAIVGGFPKLRRFKAMSTVTKRKSFIQRLKRCMVLLTQQLCLYMQLMKQHCYLINQRFSCDGNSDLLNMRSSITDEALNRIRVQPECSNLDLVP